MLPCEVGNLLHLSCIEQVDSIRGQRVILGFPRGRLLRHTQPLFEALLKCSSWRIEIPQG